MKTVDYEKLDTHLTEKIKALDTILKNERDFCERQKIIAVQVALAQMRIDIIKMAE